MNLPYQPPFHTTDNITNLVIEIAEIVGKVSVYDQLSKNPTLRRENRIKTIHSSLAIEQNTLTLEQVTAVIDGKRILAPPQDVIEVQNALDCYQKSVDFDPYNIADLLEAHRLMTKGLVAESGMFRSKGAAVYDGSQVIHMGSPPQYVPELMSQLFDWLNSSNLHPLVKSCIFHYEFEFIHPFSDGNGRVGRLWHSLILQKWQPFFAWLPIETLIHEQQQGYYLALNLSNNDGEAAQFVEFMLSVIRDVLAQISASHVGQNVGQNVGQKSTLFEKIVTLLKADRTLTASQMADALSVSKRQIERVIADLKKQGKLRRVGGSKSGYWEVT